MKPDMPYRDYFTAFLALLWSVAFFAFLAALFLVTIPEGSKDTLMLAAGVLFSTVTGACGYYFGSSQGSAMKSAAIERIAEEPKPPAKTPTAKP